jgi:lipopolysaccharide export system protein LptC
VKVELHLPDLPEVPLALGGSAPAAPRPRVPWHLRLRESLASFVPLLLMLALALATWWLAKHTPRPPAPQAPAAVRPDPDYTMQDFALERFAADGRLALRLTGTQLRHYPDGERIEVDAVRILAVAAGGRVTEARAQRAVVAADGSEAQLWGAAEVDSTDAQGRPLQFRGEFLHAFFVAERLRSHLPVQVRRGSDELRAAALDYDHPSQRLELAGPVRAQFSPRAAP